MASLRYEKRCCPSFVALPSREELAASAWHPVTKAFVKTLGDELTRTAALHGRSNPLPDCSLLSVTLWKILVQLCSRLPPSSLVVTDPPEVAELARVFASFWPPQTSKQSSIATFQTDVDSQLSEDMTSYRKWFFSVRRQLEKNFTHFLEDRLAVQAMKDYMSNYQRIRLFHANFWCQYNLINESDLRRKLADLKRMEEALAGLLYFSTASEWRSVLYALTQWKIEIDSSMSSLIKSYVIVEDSLEGKDPSDVPDLVVSFSPQTTFSEAQEVYNAVSNFLSPMLELKDMFFYFTAQNSVLFQAFMEKELEGAVDKFKRDDPRLITHARPRKSITSPSQYMVTFPTLFPRQGAGHDDDDDEEEEEKAQAGFVSLKIFAAALKSTLKCLEDLIANRARFKDVVMLGQGRLKGANVKTEFDKVVEFSAFRHYDVSKVQLAIKDMLELLQYCDLITTIVNVCEQYQMRGCLKDSRFKELKEKGTVFEDSSRIEQMTTGQCSDLKKAFDRLLDYVGPDRLHLFDAVKESEEFVKFIRDAKFYTKSGRDSFMQQIALITNQLHGEEYNDTVLNHLVVAFRCVAPFADPEITFEKLLQELSGSEKFKLQNWIGQITTVNTNMTLIKFWFSKAQGDTLENVTRDLEAIMESGKVHFDLGHSDVFGTGPCKMSLSYSIKSKEMATTAGSAASKGVPPSYLQSYRSVKHNSIDDLDLKDLDLAQKAAWTKASYSRQVSKPPEPAERWQLVERTMSRDELEDFVRKLGFVETEGDVSHQQQIKQFQRQFELFREIFSLSVQLFNLGHSHFQRKLEPYPVCTPDLEIVKDERKQMLCERQQQISELQQLHPQLLLFNMHAIFILAQALIKGNVGKVSHLVSRLFDGQRVTMQQLRSSVNKLISRVGTTDVGDSIIIQSEETPVQRVGTFLKRLVEDKDLFTRLYPARRRQRTSERSKPGKSHVVHLAYGFNLDQLLKLILQIYDGFPESYEMLRCTKKITKGDVELFMKRIQQFPYRQFTFVQVEELSIELQEDILRFQLDASKSEMGHVNYILTKHAVFHEAPWIEVIPYKEEAALPPSDRVSILFQEYVLKPYGLQVPLIVHGRAGDGKSHYIKKQISGQLCNIPVHEAFSPLLAIKKLQKLESSREIGCVYFNFTAPFPCESEVKEYNDLMTEVFWFLFSLIGLGFVEDVETGESFRLSGSFELRFFIEVPSDTSNGKDAPCLDRFLARLPLFKYVGRKHEVDPDERFDLNDDVQVVCKYLNAYDETDRKGKKKIDTLIRFKVNPKLEVPIKFAAGPDLPDEECHRLLDKYMPEHVKERKVMQHLFVKYMKRRCLVLENCPGFNYNQGRGEYYTDPTTNEQKQADTKKLGSTLMSAMLQEVAAMCNPSIKSNWGYHAHQQLVYDFKSGSASFLFLSLSPEKLDSTERDSLQKLGIRIPNVVDLGRRKLLDQYLSSALNVALEKDGQLAAIDRHEYVLTVDYAVKMLNIHERRMCGVPVIIEGETGVGKTALVRMLSHLWNESVSQSRRTAIGRLVEILRKRQPGVSDIESEGFESEFSREEVEAAFRVARALSQGNSPVEADVNVTCKAYDDIRKVLLDSIDHSALELMEVDPSVDELLESARQLPSSIGITRLFLKFLSAKPLTTFFKMSVHAALTPDDIKEFMTEKINLARGIQRRQEKSAKSPSEEQPEAFPQASNQSTVHATVVVFFDEINTSSCMGLFKEILVDRTMEGEPIPDNLFVVAACNPHRGSSTPISNSSEKEDWVLGSYYVRPLPPTLHFLRWDYGALDTHQENAYVQQKIAMDQGPLGVGLGLRVNQLSDLISAAQDMIRDFALKQLVSVGFSPSEARARAKSCVSQRDIQRVFAIATFFQKSYSASPEDTHAAVVHTSEADPIRRALLVAIGIVYYLRLDANFRKDFCKRLDDVESGCGRTPFLTIFQNEMDSYVDKMHLPHGIAKTNALKENLFATVVCTACRIPLVIVGAPGSSKTLSFNLTLTNLKGAESKKKSFRNVERFPALDPHHYQCSRRSTSLEIENVFKRAISRQQNHNKSKLPINCVVFMDEAGLPEESHESLKVLHYYLDDPEVSFVAITNHILDAAKSNRAVNLFRPKTDVNDLQTLAKGCMHSDKELVELRNVMTMIGKFCKAYLKLMAMDEFKNFFGLRDFIHFISYLRRHRGQTTELSPRLVLNALERNFNGISSKHFSFVANLFLSEMGHSVERFERRNIIKILKDSLQEKSLAHCGDDEGAEAEVRYKLIIDTSEDDSMARLLFQHGVLEKASTRIFSCSDFPGDDEIQKVHIISAIKHAALEGQTVILSQTDDINESFYDLFNQHFRRIDDPKHGRRYYANIAIGSHSKPCRVDPQFQCIVHMRQSELQNAPAPFLNRFEKFLVSQEDLLESSMQALPRQLKKVVDLARSKAKDFEKAIGDKNLYGRNEQTVDSLFLELLPVSSDDRAQRSLSVRSGERGATPQGDGDDGDDDDDDFEVYEDVIEQQWREKLLIVLEHLEHFLKSKLGFSFSPKSTEEKSALADAVFSSAFNVLGKCDFTPVKRKLIDDPLLIGSWAAESLSDTWTEFEIVDVSSTDKLLQAFALAAVTQWMVHHVCSRLLQIATPEAVILGSQFLSKYFSTQYLDHQGHFSLDELVSRALSTSNGNLSKTVCFTRTSSAIQSLPSFHSSSTALSGGKFENILSVHLDFVMCKLESVPTLEAFQSRLHAFLNGTATRLFLVIANMRVCSIRRINLIRMLAEEKEEVAGERSGKAFVLLLHYPPSMGCTKPCYPSLFLHGWDHVYLENIVRTEKGSPVDIGRWIRVGCVGEKEPGSFQSKFIDALVSFLPSTVQLALSRVVFGNHPLCFFNRKMSPSERCSLLLQLLENMRSFSGIVCLKFARCWTDEFIGEQLRLAVDSDSESAITIADKIQNRLKSLLYNYFAYVLYQLNSDYNLEILFDAKESADVKDLFLKIFSVTPVPRLIEISVRNDTFDARQPHLHRLNQRRTFPFFSVIARTIERRLDEILVEIHKELNPVFDDDAENVEGEKKNSYAVQLSRIEGIAAERLFCSLEEPQRGEEEDDDMILAVTAFAAIKQNQYLWQCYLADFAQTKLNCNMGSPGSVENTVLSTWIGDLEKYDVSQRVVALHVVARLRQKSIGQAVAALRPLEKMRDLNPLFKSDLSVLGTSLLTSSNRPAEVKDERLYSYVIVVMFDNLRNMLKKGEDIDEPFSQWCNVYQNLCSSLPDIGTFHFSERSLRPKLQCIHAIFVLVKSLRFTEQAIEAGLNVAREIVSTALAQEASMTESQRAGDVASIPLTSVIESGLQCLKHALGAEGTVQSSDALTAFVSDVLSFYFPSLPPDSPLACSLNDCQSLLRITSSQTLWVSGSDDDVTAGPRGYGIIHRSVSVEECVERSQSIPIGLISFKVFQTCLSEILKSTCGSVDSRTHFSEQIRSMVNASLAGKRGSAEVRPYIPLCYPNENRSRDPLAIVYFHCCLHQFGLKQGKISFSNLLQLLSMDELDASAEDVFYIERQALLQLTISKFAELFDPSRGTDFRQTVTEGVVEKINEIFDDESWGGGESGGHRLSFLHHLQEQLHCSRQVTKLFTENYQAKCSSFPWMKSIKESLKKPPEIQAHLFPFMIPSRANDNLQSVMHKKLAPLVAGISESSDRSAAIKELEGFCQEQLEDSSAIKYQLRMSLWLHIYYSFYERKISCKEFAASLLESFDCLDFEPEQRQLIACFLDPERMVLHAEAPNPINPDEERLELNANRVRKKRQRRQEEKIDAIWKLFNPQEINLQDASDTDLRRTLALLVAVSLGLPRERTHLWSHLLHPEMIENTSVCGNMYKYTVKRDGMLLDCGCEFTHDGDYGRADYVDYARRGTLNLHSRYLLLWMSFGALSVSLLTQPDAGAIIKGRVISDWQSVRHYCMNQVKTLWAFLRENLKFSDEERTFFVTSALHKFLEVGTKSTSDISLPIFKTQTEVDVYELSFHEQVFQPVLSQFEDKKYLDEKIWQRHELLSSVREFGSVYPVDASYKDFVHTLNYIEGAGGKSTAEELGILLKFFTEKQRLQVGGLLLPDLIEFYQWLHGELSHLVTYEEAMKLKIGHVVKRLTGRYSKKYAEYVRRLFERVKEKYNKYVDLVGGTIGFGACARVRRENDLHPISDDSVLSRLLSDSDVGDGPDALFVVICELVRSHNEFLESVVISSTASKAEKFHSVDQDQSRIHPLEVAYYNCLLGDLSAGELSQYLRNQDGGVPEEAGAELLRLIQSYHLYAPGAGINVDSKLAGKADMMTASLIAQYDFRASSMFNFERLQQAVVETFIAGKPKIEEPTCMRKVFRYRSKVGSDGHSDPLKSSTGLEAFIGMFPQKDQLPKEFQMVLPEQQRKRLEFAFHSLQYQGIADVLKAFRMITGHISQMKVELEETPGKFLEKCRTMKDDPIGEYLSQMYGSTGSENAFPDLGLGTLDVTQMQELLKMPLSCMYNAVDFFVQKLLDKEYNFAHLPITMKSPLPDGDAQAIRKLPDNYREKGIRAELSNELRTFEQVLLHAEVNMTKEPQQTLNDYLVDKKFYSSTDLPVSVLPNTIRVEHYMRVRIVLRAMINDQTRRRGGKVSFQEDETSSQTWTEIVSELWKMFPYLEPDFGRETAGVPLPLIDPTTGMFPQLPKQLWYQAEQEVDSIYDDDNEEGSDFDTLPEEDSPTAIPPFMDNVGSHDEDVDRLEKGNKRKQSANNDEDFEIIPHEVASSLPMIKSFGTSEGLTVEEKPLEEKPSVEKPSEEKGVKEDGAEERKVEKEEAEKDEEEKPRLSHAALTASVMKRELADATGEASSPADLAEIFSKASPRDQALFRKMITSGMSMSTMGSSELRDLSGWTVDDVCSFLDDIGMKQYVEKFRSEEIDGGLLQELDQDGLKELDVSSGLHRSKILKKIKETRKSGGTAGLPQ
ncbi:uncharacterized protein [Oscarella lobularis]|uniref:uncharacterized protein isoform X2 n=1 Tax=Oscarella lobularis TaxID=121494 RepID=UPI0033140C07